MEDCVFCKIVEGEIPAAQFWDDGDHIALLDLFPRVKGQTVVTTKKHFGGYAFDMPDEAYVKLLVVAKKIGKLLDKVFSAERTVMITEGYGVDHVHVKLYPNPKGAYEGYTTTALGKKTTIEELEKVAEEIKRLL